MLSDARVAAANTLLDRAYGKAPTFSTTDPGTFKRAIDMTDDELAAIVGRAKLTLVKSDTNPLRLKLRHAFARLTSCLRMAFSNV